MAFPLDPEQLRAVQTTGTSVVLTAGAGCGKTGTITAKFLNLLGKREPDGRLAPAEERVSLGRIGVMTFTNKAAAELRHRIRTACEDESRAASVDDTEAAQYWQLVAFAMEGATISTYHSFYEQLCREHAEALGLDPEFKLLDEQIAAALRRESAQEAVRQRLASHDPLLIEYAARHRLDVVVEQIQSLISLGDHQTRVSLLAEMDDEQLANIWQQLWDDQIRPMADLVRDCLFRIIAFDRKGFTKNWQEQIEQAETELGSLHDDYFKALVRATGCLKGPKLNRPGLKEALDELYELRDSDTFELMKAGLDLLDQAMSETVLMARLTQSALAHYAELKGNRRAVDFDDLVEKTNELASQSIPLGGRHQRRFDHFLVDEFQDTDRLQAAILKSLAGNPFDTGQLFVVGDVKQAIYRFRGANPDELLNLRQAMPPAGRQSLVRNYRSRRQIVDFVNTLAVAMYQKPGEENAARDVQLIAGLQSPLARDTSRAAIDFLWTRPRDQATQANAHTGDEGEAQSRENYRAEAAALAVHLKNMVEAGVRVGARSASPEGWAVGAKDIVYISRSRTHWALYEQALRREGFEVHLDSVGAFFQQQEVRDLVHLLAVVENPLDDIRLAATLRGPLCGVSDETLFWLGQQSGRTSFAEQFWKTDQGDLHFVTEAEKQNLQRAKATITQLAALRAGTRPSQIVRQAIAATEAATLVARTWAEPEQALANLAQLVDEARAFDHDVDLGWPAMIRQWLANLEGSKTDEAVVEAPTGKVRFLTIHSSKGLEFPVVVMPGLHSQSRSTSSPFLIHPQLGLITRSRSADTDETETDDHPAWKLTKQAIKIEEEHETDNLFYVAATRAMDHLVLSAVFDPNATDRNNQPAKPTGPFLKRLASAFDLGTGRALVPVLENLARVTVKIVTSNQTETAR